MGALSLDQGMLEILVLAFIAGFVLFRLYVTLGRRTGAEQEPRPAPAPGGLSPDVPLAKPAPVAQGGPAGEGLAGEPRHLRLLHDLDLVSGEEVIDVLLQAAIPGTMTQERMDQIRKKVIQNLQDKYPEAGIRPAQSSRASPLDGLLDSPQHG